MKYLGQSFSTSVPRYHRWKVDDDNTNNSVCEDCGMTWKTFNKDPQKNAQCKVSKAEQKS